MNAVTHKVLAFGNRAASWLYLRSKGRVGGSAKGIPVLLLTLAGRKTGILRSVPLAYFEHGGGYLVTGSAGGVKADPQWIHNLRAAEERHVHIREKQYAVDARVAGRDERDELWRSVVLDQAPFFAEYEKKSGRVIPVALLTPRPETGRPHSA